LETAKISTDEVTYVANLARLTFDEEEMVRFTLAAQRHPPVHGYAAGGRYDRGRADDPRHRQKNAFRTDAVGESLPVETALANAPEVRGNCFDVPKVIE